MSLADENLAVDAEEVLTLHAFLARDSADEQAPIRILETLIEIARGNDVGKQRERTVLKFHHDASEGV